MATGQVAPAVDVAHDYRLGFRSQRAEIAVDDLPVEGSVPTWLSGTLVRNGPANYEVGDRRVNHWFDGQAMLHRFGFADGHVSYANRFLQTRARRAAEETGEIRYSEFATDPCRSLFQRVAALFDPKLSDNASVNVVRLGERFMAMTETPLPVDFDPQTLQTLGVSEWEDKIGFGATTAHPHLDPATGELVNYLTSFGRKTAYNVYALAPGSRSRRLIASIPVKEPGYMHSFAITERYVVLMEHPLVVNPLKLALSGRPFVENYRWEPERGTRFLVVDRAAGELKAIHHGPACFVFHHINAWEEGDDIVIDACRVRGRGDRLRALPRRAALRPRVDPARVPDPLPPGRWRGDERAHRHGVDRAAADRLQALQHQALPLRLRHRRQRRLADLRPAREDRRPDRRGAHLARGGDASRRAGVRGRPGADGEDEGVALSVVLDARSGDSFLLVLDAETFEERARARVPQYVPYGFHGAYFS